MEIEIPHFNTVSNPIHLMEEEHDTAGNVFKEIARLSNNYTRAEET